MPEIKDIFLNDTNYLQTSRVSQWLNVSDINSLSYSVYCSENCDLRIEWSASNEPIQIIETNVYNLTGNSTVNVHTSVKWRYARFSVINIVSTPCNLKCQLFF